jgi:beta-glucosidase/6-phospho-beta-glucosidase/beta-galactosidase
MFKSFFQGGFECTIGHNREGEWIDLVEDTWHHHHIDEDYRRLRAVGIAVARDAIRWPLVDRGGRHFDFSTVRPFVEAAQRHGMEVVWDLFHYGYPEDLDLLSDAFPERFAEYCAACARYLRRRLRGTLWFTPVNEPSYLAWAGGEVAHFRPYLNDRAHDVKVALVRAAIRGIDAIRAEVPDARFVHADPLCRVVPRDDQPQSLEAARRFNEDVVFESWDMLSGKRRPELGGSPSHLDVIGVNYYWNCQWVHGEQGSWLEPDDPRRVPLAKLVQQVWRRYGSEIVISETSHWGEHRAAWMEALTDEVEAMLRARVPLRAVCLYPIIGMLDWHSPRRWMPMGLWDIDADGGMRRVLHKPMLQALRRAQRRVEHWMRSAGGRGAAPGD